MKTTVNDDLRNAPGTPLAASVEDIIGDYRSFFVDLAGRALYSLLFRTMRHVLNKTL